MADQCNLVATLDLSSSEGNADLEFYTNSAPFPFPVDSDEYFTSDQDISATADEGDEIEDTEQFSPANLDDEEGIVQFIDEDEEALDEVNEE